MRFLIVGDVHCYGHYVFEAIKQVGKGGPIDAVVCTGDLNERSFMQSESGYHSVNAGSLWQSAKWDNITGNVVGHYLPVVIVAQCDGATLSMERVDVIQQKAIGKPWIIAPDVDNSIAARAKRAPQMRFAEGDLQITNVGPCAALISYPQASGEVEYYLATATDKDGEQVSAQFTSYYYLPREGRGRMVIEGLTPDCEYSLTLCPVDFYGNQGTPLTARFKTTPAVPTFNEVLYEGPILAHMWTGDVDFIREEVGFATDSDDVRPFIISKNSFDLGSSFEVFTHNHRNRYNNSDDDFSCLQVGRYTAATCRTRDDNRVAILDGWQIGDGNPFESDRVIAATKLPYTIESGTVGLTLKDGTLTMWRDDLPALTVAAEGFSAPVKVALQLGETWGVFKNCAYFDSISVLK